MTNLLYNECVPHKDALVHRPLVCPGQLKQSPKSSAATHNQRFALTVEIVTLLTDVLYSYRQSNNYLGSCHPLSLQSRANLAIPGVPATYNERLNAFFHAQKHF